MGARRLASVCLFACAVLSHAASQPPVLRLGDSTRPLRYALDLRIVPAEEGFRGTVDIDLELRQPSDTIWMHGVGLTVTSAEIRTGSGTIRARPVSSREFLGFETDTPVPAGKASLHVEYTGRFAERSSAGLFRNRYGSDWYAASQFEATDARRAFPCFDEPDFKVPWQLTLHVKQDQSAFSNTPVQRETSEPGGMKEVRFAETKPLPSYLVAMAVGPYDVVDAGRAGKRRTPVRIITLHGQAGWAKWAAEATPPLFTALEDYFGIPYPYEKLDEVAVPLFFGAMENPGLITYAQQLIVAKPGEDTIRRRRSFASVAAHEMAHQWFGDLVTLEWWDDTWLNEAFASWMEQKIIAAWKPDWKTGVSDAADAQRAMKADSLLSARRIRQPISSQNDIANAFDAITYDKGAAVIHMFERWAGPDKFRRGIQEYMRMFAFKNATAADFLRSVSAAAGRDLAAPFSTFLDQPGVPLVAVSLACGSAGPSLDLSQKRYLPLGSQDGAAGTWRIPVCVRYPDGGAVKRECFLLEGASSAVRLQSKSCPAWVMANDAANGYYRTAYSADLRTALLHDPAVLSAPERLSFVGDVEALVGSGSLPGGEALRIAAQFGNDPGRQVVSETIAIAAGMDRRVVAPGLRPNFVRFVRKVYGARARQLGWTPAAGEDNDLRLLRADLVPFVAIRGEDEVLEKQALELTREWLANRRAIPPDLVNPVLTTAARNGDRALWDNFHTEARATRDERDRAILLAAMSAFRDPAIVESNLKVFLSGEFDYREAVPLLFSGAEDPRTRELPFHFLQAHYDELTAKLPASAGTEFRAELPRVASAFCDENQLSEVRNFFGPRSETALGGPRILEQVVEGIRQCIAFRETQQASVEDFLKSY